MSPPPRPPPPNIVTLPNFLVIGAEKSGTTALHELLATHPQVFMSEPKEPSFFLSEDRRYLAQDLMGQPSPDIRTQSEYEEIFAAAPPAKVIGESSPCYLYSPEAAQLIKATIPGVRIVALLRNPAERAFSQFTFNQQRGWEPLTRTFKEALELEEERVQGDSMWAFHYTRRGMYARQLTPNPIKAIARGLMPTRARSALGGMLRRMNARRPTKDDQTVRSLMPVFEEDIRQLAATILPKAADWLSRG